MGLRMSTYYVITYLYDYVLYLVVLIVVAIFGAIFRIRLFFEGEYVNDDWKVPVDVLFAVHLCGSCYCCGGTVKLQRRISLLRFSRRPGWQLCLATFWC